MSKRPIRQKKRDIRFLHSTICRIRTMYHDPGREYDEDTIEDLMDVEAELSNIVDKFRLHLLIFESIPKNSGKDVEKTFSAGYTDGWTTAANKFDRGEKIDLDSYTLTPPECCKGDPELSITYAQAYRRGANNFIERETKWE